MYVRCGCMIFFISVILLKLIYKRTSFNWLTQASPHVKILGDVIETNPGLFQVNVICNNL